MLWQPKLSPLIIAEASFQHLNQVLLEARNHLSLREGLSVAVFAPVAGSNDTGNRASTSVSSWHVHRNFHSTLAQSCAAQDLLKVRRLFIADKGTHAKIAHTHAYLYYSGNF